MTARSQSGVTLLETLIALVILSLAIAATIAMTNTARLLNTAAQKRQRIVESAFGEAFLRAQLESIAPAVRETVNGAPIMDFYGAPSEIRFISSSIMQAELPMLQRTGLAISDGKLIMRRGPAKIAGEVASRALVTLPGPAKFQYGEIGVDGQLRFSDRWIDRERLPDVIALTGNAGPDNRSMPILAAEPALSSRF